MDSLVRSNIIKVAESLFVKYGIKSIKVDDICNELHMSKKTFYTEFENKEALIEIVWDNICKKGPERFHNISEIETCNNIIDLWMQGPSLAAREHNKKYEIFVYDLLKYYPNIREERDKKEFEKVHTVLNLLLDKGIEQGLFRDDMDKEFLISFSLDMNNQAINRLLQLPKNEHVNYVLFLLDLWVRAVCSEKGLDYYLKNYTNAVKK
jgi:AcrR family transcriptional regulator